MINNNNNKSDDTSNYNIVVAVATKVKKNKNNNNNINSNSNKNNTEICSSDIVDYPVLRRPRRIQWRIFGEWFGKRSRKQLLCYVILWNVARRNVNNIGHQLLTIRFECF